MISVRKFMREAKAFAPTAVLGVALLLPVHPARAASPVETFAQHQIDRGIQILTDKTLAPQARQESVRDFLLSVMDLNKISRFVLGPAAQSASKDDLVAFDDAFRRFTLANYESQIGAYDGQTLRVVRSVELSPKDYVVTADVLDRGAASNTAPVEVDFRILDEDGSFAVVDASVEGVWFEVAQRESVQAFLQQNGQSIPKLVAHLNEMTARIAPENQSG